MSEDNYDWLENPLLEQSNSSNNGTKQLTILLDLQNSNFTKYINVLMAGVNVIRFLRIISGIVLIFRIFKCIFLKPKKENLNSDSFEKYYLGYENYFLITLLGQSIIHLITVLPLIYSGKYIRFMFLQKLNSILDNPELINLNMYNTIKYVGYTTNFYILIWLIASLCNVYIIIIQLLDLVIQLCYFLKDLFKIHFINLNRGPMGYFIRLVKLYYDRIPSTNGIDIYPQEDSFVF